MTTGKSFRWTWSLECNRAGYAGYSSEMQLCMVFLGGWKQREEGMLKENTKDKLQTL